MKNEHSFYPPPYELKAFTLAEVLITLVIIGVIAAITVPSLMNNTNGEEYKSALKKAISAANQALALHYALEGEGAQEYSTPEAVVSNIFKKRMNVVEINDDTFPDDYKIEYSYAPLAFAYNCKPDSKNSFITQDGIIYCISSWDNGSTSSRDEESKACNSYNSLPCTEVSVGAPNLYIDVNGVKKPNKITSNSSRLRDQYVAQIYNTKVVPYNGVAACVMSNTPNCSDPMIAPPMIFE